MSSKKRIVASTKVYSDEYIYTWTIENYRLLKFNVGEKIESPKFGVGSDDEKYFNLQLYPAGRDAESAEYISLYLKPVIDSTNKPDKLLCRWTLSAINDKKVFLVSTIDHDFVTTGFVNRGWSKFHKLENIDELISAKNTATFQCELEIFKKYESSLKLDVINNEEQIIDKVKLDPLCLSEEFSDVKIITPDANDIPAHKAVLAMASPVFRAMFTHNMLENQESSVKITDSTKNILTEMLRFIYTGQINAIETDMLIELLAVADKYQIDSLKNKCGKMLCVDLSTENAIKILIAAHKYKAKYLEDKVIKFVSTHIELLSNSEEIKEIDNSIVWVNLMQSVIKSQKNVS